MRATSLPSPEALGSSRRTRKRCRFAVGENGMTQVRCLSFHPTGSRLGGKGPSDRALGRDDPAHTKAVETLTNQREAPT